MSSTTRLRDAAAPAMETVPVALPGGRQRSPLRAMLRRPSVIVFGAVLAAFALVAVFGPFVVADPVATASPKLLPPSAEHLLGTDMLGRDDLSRVVYGGRISLLVGFTVAALCLTVGLVVGGIAGDFGGAADTAMVKLAEFFQVLPGIVLALVAAALLGANIWIIVGILAVTMYRRVSLESSG